MEPLTIRLADAARLEGSVVGPGGEVPAGTYVQVADARTVLEGSYEVASIWQKVARQPVTADGRFAVELPWFEGRGSDGYIVRAVASGCAPFATDPVRVAPGETKSGIRIRLEAGHTLRGVVVHSDGSGPVAGARVEFSNDRPAPGPRAEARLEHFGLQQSSVRDHGHHRHRREVRHPEPAGVHLPPARVRAATRLGANRPCAFPPMARCGSRCSRRGNLRGRVLYEDATPAAWVQVRAHRPGKGFIGAQGTTDADGNFAFGVGEGEFLLETRADWRYPVDVVPGGLEACLRTGGRDRASGAAWQGVDLGTLRGVRRGTGARRMDPLPHTGRRRDDDPLQPERRVHAGRAHRGCLPHPRGGQPQSRGGPERYGKPIVAQSGPIRTGSDGVILEFRPALEISGRVFGPDGNPPRGTGLVVRGARRLAVVGLQRQGRARRPPSASATCRPGAFTIALIDPRGGKPLPLATGAPVEAGSSGVDLRYAQQRRHPGARPGRRRQAGSQRAGTRAGRRATAAGPRPDERRRTLPAGGA